MAAPAFSIAAQHSARLADPALREALLRYARRRLPQIEVEDLVQNTLTDALVSANPPGDEREFQRWVHGIARHKVADLYRRRGRTPLLDAELDGKVGRSDPGPATGELSQWIERELPQTDGAQATLHWLLRESDGETLDEIARDEALPAPRVRQRVSRLRRHLHTRWLALGAAGLGLLLYAGTSLYLWRSQKSPEISKETPAHVRPSNDALAPLPSPAGPDAAPTSSPPISKLGSSTKANSVESAPPTKSNPKQKAAPNKKSPKKPAPRKSAPSKRPAPKSAQQQLAPNNFIPSKADPTQNFDANDFPAQRN
ncbi:MAG: sigma factor [Pseudomonadota bacterium]